MPVYSAFSAELFKPAAITTGGFVRLDMLPTPIFSKLLTLGIWHLASTTEWVEALFRGREALSSHEADLKTLHLQLSRAQSRIVLIGPDVVRFAGAQYHDSIFSDAERYQVVQSAEDLPALVDADDTAGLQEARGVLLAFMNRAIGIGPRRRFRPKFARVE